jgi:uncharacterized membrane protein
MHKHSHRFQKAGVFLTALCAIHCMAMPFLLTAIPFLGDYLSETVEHIIVIVSLLMATFILYKDYKQHKIKTPFILFGLGGLLQLTAVLFVKNQIETILLVSGGFIIMAAYFINWRLHQKVFHEH